MKNNQIRLLSLVSLAVFLAACNADNHRLAPIAADAELNDTVNHQPEKKSATRFERQPSITLTAAPRTITIDGDFSDWQGIQAATYTIGAETTVNLGEQSGANKPTDIQAAFDDEWLYLKLSLGRVANLQGFEGTVMLEFDLDGNPLTGIIRRAAAPAAPAPPGILGLPGIDYVLEFSPRNPRSNRTVGVAASAFERGVGSTALNPYTLRPSFAPTYASEQVEFRIQRGVELPGTNLRSLRSPSFNLRLSISDSAQSANQLVLTMIIELAPDAELPSSHAPISPTINRPSGAVRVLSWNVEKGRLFEDPAPFARVIRAVNPQVICFQEIGDQKSARDLQRWLEEYVRAPEGWEVQVSPGTGTAIAARIASVRTGPLQMPALAASRNSIRNTMLLIASGGRRIVVSSVHLKCCGRAGDRSDRKRIAETAQIKQLIAEAVAEDHATGILIMGDFNLVGSRIPLDNLALGTDLNGTNLRDVAPVRLNGHTNTTWRDPGQPFLPGRLDFALVSDSTIKVVNSFLLDTELLKQSELDHLKLRRDDTTKTSDHLPLVVDLKW